MTVENSSELWNEFLEVYKPARTVKVGQKDKAGNLLILGGYKCDLYKTTIGTYLCAGEYLGSPEEAIEAYNKVNNTKLQLDYIQRYFEPWYQEVSNKTLMEFPSKSDPSRPPYKVRIDLEGSITCNCRGFLTHKHCWHTDAVKYIKEQANESQGT